MSYGGSHLSILIVCVITGQDADDRVSDTKGIH